MTRTQPKNSRAARKYAPRCKCILSSFYETANRQGDLYAYLHFILLCGQYDVTHLLFWCFVLQWYIAQQVPQFEDVKFEAASILSEIFCQQVSVHLSEEICFANLYLFLTVTVVYVSNRLLSSCMQHMSRTIWDWRCEIFLVNTMICEWLWTISSRIWWIPRSPSCERLFRYLNKLHTGTADYCSNWQYVP